MKNKSLFIIFIVSLIIFFGLFVIYFFIHSQVVSLYEEMQIIRKNISEGLAKEKELDLIKSDIKKTLSDYEKEKRMILDACKKPSKTTEQHTYEFDLVVTDPKKKHTYILEMKGPDPNTTEVPGAKKRLLVAIAWAYFKTKSEKIDSHFAIYYNNKHPKVYKNPKVHYYFNPAGGTIVQEDFWNFLGKNTQTFNSLTKLFESYGKTNKKKIWDGFSKLIDIK